MKYSFDSLDERTRQLMMEEIKHDIENSRLYTSKRFNDHGLKLYPEILQNIVLTGDEQELAIALKTADCFKDKEERKTKTGISFVKVPETAHLTFAEGEFNRFYMRGLCRYAIENNLKVQVCRARYSEIPRSESESLIDAIMDAGQLLEDLRQNTGVDTALGLPSGPNSGLSIRLYQ